MGRRVEGLGYVWGVFLRSCLEGEIVVEVLEEDF